MTERQEWFAAKRYGIGAGMPIAWQGWAILLASLATIAGAALLLVGRPHLQVPIILLTTAALLIVAFRTTRGGWRWRWGDRD